MALFQQTVTDEEGKQEWRSEASRADVGNAPGTAPATEVESTKERRSAYGQPFTGEIPAAARHIRPDELLAALSAIEARKGEAVVGSVPLGDALNQVRANVTPDEVWQEVDAQRKLQGHNSNNRKITDLEAQRRRKRWGQAGGGIACMLVTALALRFLVGDIKKVEAIEQPKPVKPQVIPQRVPDVVYGPMAQVTRNSVRLTDLKPGDSMWMGVHEAQTLEKLFFGDEFVKPLTKAQLETVFIDPFQSWNLSDQWHVVMGPDGHFRFQVWADIPAGTPVADIYTNHYQYHNRPDSPDMANKPLRPLTFSVNGFQSYSGRSNGAFIRYDAVIKKNTPLSWEPIQFTPPPPAPDGPVPVKDPPKDAPTPPTGMELSIRPLQKVDIGPGRYIFMERRKPFYDFLPKASSNSNHFSNHFTLGSQ